MLISNEIGSGLRMTFGLPMLFECMAICDVNTAHESKLGGCPVDVYMLDSYLFIYLFIYLFKFSQGTCPWMVSALK